MLNFFKIILFYNYSNSRTKQLRNVIRLNNKKLSNINKKKKVKTKPYSDKYNPV